MKLLRVILGCVTYMVVVSYMLAPTWHKNVQKMFGGNVLGGVFIESFLDVL